ncbi:MAG: hypothetical protein KGJ09_10320 [Candidatus Omnitrophica bacterium]|nr:hypothetical protein [Candidatus Omnitrophota bacterium]
MFGNMNRARGKNKQLPASFVPGNCLFCGKPFGNGKKIIIAEGRIHLACWNRENYETRRILLQAVKDRKEAEERGAM